MARRKRKGRRRYSRKRSRSGRKNRTPLAAGVGLAYTGWKAATGAEAGNTPMTLIKGGYAAQVPDAVWANIKANYTPAMYGLALSAGKDLPIVSIVLRPVNKIVKKLTKGKMEL